MADNNIEDTLKVAKNEIVLRLKDRRIQDANGNFVVSVVTKNSSYLLLEETKKESETMPAIILDGLRTRHSASHNKVVFEVSGNVYNRRGFKDGEDITTSGIVSVVMNTGEAFNITRVEPMTATAPVTIYASKLQP